MKKRTFFAFDLDGTVTKQEILPIIAEELNIEDEMRLLTELTLNGTIGFDESFEFRVNILKKIPLSRIHEIISTIELDRDIENFIHKNKENCAIVTGNLDVWLTPLIQRLDCKFYSSKGYARGDRLIGLTEIIDKSKAISEIRKYADNVVSIGESANDIPMFAESDITVAFGGVHQPAMDIIQISDYVIYDGNTLCRLLNTFL
ncbi:MAG TPA: HAD-IB family phosphatase [Clostridia bacterium]|nr:HAD-IB family phosphatase [Clostridia bacterium]